MKTSKFKIDSLVIWPVVIVKRAERIEFGTIDGQPAAIEMEHDGTTVGWIGTESFTLTPIEYNELKRLFAVS